MSPSRPAADGILPASFYQVLRGSAGISEPSLTQGQHPRLEKDASGPFSVGVFTAEQSVLRLLLGSHGFGEGTSVPQRMPKIVVIQPPAHVVRVCSPGERGLG